MRNNFINSFSIDTETENIIKRVALEKKCTKSKAVIFIVKEYERLSKMKEGLYGKHNN